jgi:hypothetical protein
MGWRTGHGRLFYWSIISRRDIHRDPLVQLEYEFVHGAGVVCCQSRLHAAAMRPRRMQCESLDDGGFVTFGASTWMRTCSVLGWSA